MHSIGLAALLAASLGNPLAHSEGQALSADGDELSKRQQALAQDPGSQVTKLALLFGAEDYENHKGVRNAWNDVSAFARALYDLGFDHIEVEAKPTQASIILLLEGLRKKRDDIRRSTGIAPLIFVFFAGHGFKIGTNNYFLPIDATNADLVSLETSAIPQSHIIDQIASEKYSLSIVVLDICRVEAESASVSGNVADSSVLGSGLVKDERSGGTNLFVVYSAGDGRPALSQVDVKDVNSPFTSAYTRFMMRRDFELYRIYQEVRLEVLNRTGQRQIPFADPKTPSQFYFSPGEVYGREMSAAWKETTENPTKEMLGDFVQRYPTSLHAASALKALDELDNRGK